MSIEKKLTKCEPDNPNRCQTIVQMGQCPYLATSGKYCDMHKAGADYHAAQQSCRMYRINRWQARINEIADHDKVKSLREEIGITRMVLEEILQKCDDSTTILLYSSKIVDLITRIEKLVTSCHRLEASSGMLLDKTAALNIALKIVDIISGHVTDETIIENIANQIIENILTQKQEAKVLPNGS